MAGEAMRGSMTGATILEAAGVREQIICPAASSTASFRICCVNVFE